MVEAGGGSGGNLMALWSAVSGGRGVRLEVCVVYLDSLCLKVA